MSTLSKLQPTAPPPIGTPSKLQLYEKRTRGWGRRGRRAEAIDDPRQLEQPAAHVVANST